MRDRVHKHTYAVYLDHHAHSPELAHLLYRATPHAEQELPHKLFSSLAATTCYIYLSYLTCYTYTYTYTSTYTYTYQFSSVRRDERSSFSFSLYHSTASDTLS